MSSEKVKEMIKDMCPMQSSFYRPTEIMQVKDQQEMGWLVKYSGKRGKGFAWFQS